jgi:predicted nucleotidyltransferase
MLFHSYLEMLLGSKVKVTVLRTLWKFKEKEFTIRELAQFLEISHTGVRKVLRDFEKMNVLTIRTIGRSYAFKLNTKSYGYSIVEKLFEMEENTLLELKKMLNKGLGVPSIISAALFGSIVQGKEAPLSDIDLLIVTPKKENVEGIVAELQKEVSEKFGNSISAYYVNEEDLQKRREQSPIKQAVQNHVLICGRPLE